MKLPLKFRGFKSEDQDFIFDSWLRSYRESENKVWVFEIRDPKSDGVRRQIKDDVFFPEHRRLIQKLNCPALIACNPDDEDQIYGYLVGKHFTDSSVIHYIYVKEAFKHMKVASTLIERFQPQKTLFYTHLNYDGAKLIEQNQTKTNWCFNPYFFYDPT